MGWKWGWGTLHASQMRSPAQSVRRILPVKKAKVGWRLMVPALRWRELGQGWKVSPSIHIQPLETVTLADIEGPGAIKHIWLTVHPDFWRCLILRMYWDDETSPSVETPLGDFFCNGWCERANVNSLPVSVNSAGGFNCFGRCRSENTPA